MWLTTPWLALKLWLPSVHTHGPNIHKNTFKLKGPRRKLLPALSLSLSLSLSHTHTHTHFSGCLHLLPTTGVRPQREGKEGVGSKQKTFQELNVIPVFVPKKIVAIIQGRNHYKVDRKIHIYIYKNFNLEMIQFLT